MSAQVFIFYDRRKRKKQCVVILVKYITESIFYLFLKFELDYFPDKINICVEIDFMWKIVAIKIRVDRQAYL